MRDPFFDNSNGNEVLCFNDSMDMTFVCAVAEIRIRICGSSKVWMFEPYGLGIQTVLMYVITRTAPALFVPHHLSSTI